MIGISEGIVLADRYRLTRRQSERETGASWIAVDLETGSDVWVQLSDQGGLARAAEVVRGLTPPAAPTVLETGELRMIADSRALTAVRDGEEAHAAHVEIVIEFVVVKPLAGRGLAAKIARRALPPAEALAVAAMLADVLDEALPTGGSHGWLNAGSVWPVRRGGCVLDLASGLAYPDGSPIALEQQVSGYFAPERLAASREPGAAVGSGSQATEAADVFALGWLLYEALIGHAELLAEYERLVAGAGAVTTVELLALWRTRARVHVTELTAAESALAVLVLECLAEKSSERPGLGAFAERARSAGALLAGVAPLILPPVRTRPAAAEAAATAAVLGAGIVGGALVDASEGLVSGQLAGAALVGAETTLPPAATGTAGAGGADSGTARAESDALGHTSEYAGGSAPEVESRSPAGAEVEILAAAGGAGAVSVISGSGEHERALARLTRRVRLATIVGAAATVIALVVGLAVGYAVGHVGHGGSSAAALTAATANVTGEADASSRPTPTVVVTVTAATATSSSGAAADSPASTAPTAVTSPPLPAPNSATEAINELHQEIQYELSAGQISGTTASRLTTAVGVMDNSLGTRSSWQSLSSLTSLVRSMAGTGRLPSGAEISLESILGYFYASSGS